MPAGPGHARGYIGLGKIHLVTGGFLRWAADHIFAKLCGVRFGVARMMKIVAFCLILANLSAVAFAGSPPASQPVTGDGVLHFLNETIDWYHRVDALDTASSRQSQELLLRASVRDDATQAVRLGLAFAKAAAATLEPAGATTLPTTQASAGTSKNGSTKAGAPANVQASNLTQVAAAAADRAAKFQVQLDVANSELASTQPTSRPALLAARRDRLAAQVNLAQAQRDVMLQYAGFVSSAQGDTAGLAQKIAEIQQSVPEIPLQAPATQPSNTDETTAVAVAAAAQPSAPAAPPSNGILSLLRDLFSITSHMSELSDLSKDAAKLGEQADRFRAPIRANLLDAVRRADAFAATTQASDDPTAIDTQSQQIEALTTRFKALAAASVPLGEQRAVLDAAVQRLNNWHDLLSREYRSLLRELLLHVVLVGITIFVLIVISELWRRATYRYITDIRRRRQLMVVRRIVIAVVVVITIIASVVSEFGSLATFAGLITAGIAVALQTVILSGVAYFFFIGRYGVRVGDRVTISGITGDVIDIGLFRLYLMELSGAKPDLRPTGRVVVFSNSVLFQPSAFYKQMPGTNYAWREVSFTLSPATDYNLAEKRLLGAVQPVFAEYADRLESQQAAVSESLHIPVDPPKPHGRLRFVDSSVQFILRYPVELGRAPEIDDSITRKLLDAINQEPSLKMVATSTPNIQPAP